MKRAKLTVRLIFWSLALLLIARAVMAWCGAGRWLIKEDPISPTGVVVILSGGAPYRAEEAANLFRLGYASQVWVSWPLSPGDNLEKLGIHFTGDEEYNRQVLTREGVPSDAIRLFSDPIVDTKQ